MSRGAGWLARATRAPLDASAAAGVTLWCARTAHFCRVMYGCETPTKAQLVAMGRVLRALAYTPPGRSAADPWAGEPWRLYRYHHGQGWNFDLPPVPDIARPAEALDRKLAKVLAMMGSSFEGERASAAAMAERIRREAGVEWADIVSIGRRRGPPGK